MQLTLAAILSIILACHAAPVLEGETAQGKPLLAEGIRLVESLVDSLEPGLELVRLGLHGGKDGRLPLLAHEIRTPGKTIEARQGEVGSSPPQ